MSEPAPALPEVRWTWRRVFAFLVTGAALAIVALVVVRTQDAGALKWIALSLVGLVVLQSLFYLGGATLTDLSRLAAAFPTLRRST